VAIDTRSARAASPRSASYSSPGRKPPPPSPFEWGSTARVREHRFRTELGVAMPREYLVTLGVRK
jgi:hypothetical protein